MGALAERRRSINFVYSVSFVVVSACSFFVYLNVITRFIRVIQQNGKKILQLLDAPTKPGHDQSRAFLIIIIITIHKNDHTLTEWISAS